MNEKIKEEFLQLIKASLGLDSIPTIPSDSFEMLYYEFKAHAIWGLPVKILSTIVDIPNEVREKWRNDILFLAYEYGQYTSTQKDIIQLFYSNGIQFSILKGTSASQYYDTPEFRVMGDIDIIPAREQFEIACEVLQKNGYKKISYEPPFRCMVLKRNNVYAEIHRFFAKMNDPKKAEYLDSLIFTNILVGNPFLPDPINGLVLLQHVDHHLENGIGLRQIIDWYMFAKRYLSDENWKNTFSDLARNLGLEKLAITLTRMCQIHLGLDPNITWCCFADRKLCNALMDYILDSGNFGRKHKRKEFAVQTAFFEIKHPVRYFKKLQEYGIARMKLDNIRFLPSSLAWCYQLYYSVTQLFHHHLSIVSIVKQIKKAKKRKQLLDTLGVKQEIKGLAIYENGKYVRK